MNKLKEGVAGRKIVQFFEENYGKEPVNAVSIGGLTGAFDYRLTFADGEVGDYRVVYGQGMDFAVQSAEPINRLGSGLADDDGALVTIQAKALIENGDVTGVRLTGVSALSQHAVIGIAYEAIHATYGSVHHRRVPIFTDREWTEMRETEPESITLRVHTY